MRLPWWVPTTLIDLTGCCYVPYQGKGWGPSFSFGMGGIELSFEYNESPLGRTGSFLFASTLAGLELVTNMWNEQRRSSESQSAAHSCFAPCQPRPKATHFLFRNRVTALWLLEIKLPLRIKSSSENVNVLKMKHSAHQLKLVLPPRFPRHESLMSPRRASGI